MDNMNGWNWILSGCNGKQVRIVGNKCCQNLVPLPCKPRLKEAHLWRGEYEEAATCLCFVQRPVWEYAIDIRQL